MTMKVSQWQRIALLVAGISVSIASVAWGGNTPLYELHSDGSIWQYTGVPCNGNGCSGWQQLDNNSQTMVIAATGGRLYQLHDFYTNNNSDQTIWEYTGQPCSGGFCRGWVQIGAYQSGTEMISAGSGVLVQARNDGTIWSFTGQACSGVSNCPGWLELNSNGNTSGNVVVGQAGLLEQNYDGSIWQFIGPACTGSNCPGWRELDDNPNTLRMEFGCEFQTNCGIASGTLWAYQLWTNGAVWQYTGPPCNGSCPGWRLMDNNPKTTQITAGGGLYELHNDGSIWQSTGTPCNGNNCYGWWEIDNNPAATHIVAGPSTVYELHNDGTLWQYTGVPCDGNVCSGWIELDNNPAISLVVPSN